MRGAEQSLRALLADGRAWVQLGLVTERSPSPDGGWRLTCALQPSGDLIEARPLWMQAGGAGLFVPIEVGAEVVLLMPGGDPLQAVALAGPPSRGAAAPLTWLQDGLLAAHPGGLSVQGAGLLPPTAVVVEGLLPQLATALGEVSTALAGLGAPPTPGLAALISALATDFRAAALRTE